MKNFERIVATIALLGIILKLCMVSSGSILIVISLSTLYIFYFLSFIFLNGIRFRDIFKRESYKHTNAKRIIGAIGIGFALSTIIMGILFKLLFWTGADQQLIVGLPLAAFISIIAFIFYLRNKIEYYRRIFRRVAIIGGFGLLLYLTPTNTLVDLYYRNDPEYAELYKKVLSDPYNQELRKQFEIKRQQQELLEE